MSLDDAYYQYLKCLECNRYSDCPDFETKIRYAIDKHSLFHKLQPINPLRPYQPYKSKYFDDHRYDQPRKATAQDVICAYEKLKGGLYD